MTHYHINVFWSATENCWIADVPDLKSCSGVGHTPEEALAEARQAMAAWLDVAAAKNLPIPEPCGTEAVFRILSDIDLLENKLRTEDFKNTYGYHRGYWILQFLTIAIFAVMVYADSYIFPEGTPIWYRVLLVIAFLVMPSTPAIIK